jgi:hypothetical protein
MGASDRFHLETKTKLFQSAMRLLLLITTHFIHFPLATSLMASHSGRAILGVGLGRLVAGIVGSNPAQGMDVCPRLSVLCCPV